MKQLPTSWLRHPTQPAKRLRTLVAVHEAGHAVMAAMAGATTGYVTIVPTRATGGHCCMPLPPNCGEGARALTYAAGDAAVLIFRASGTAELQRLLIADRAGTSARAADDDVDAAQSDTSGIQAMIACEVTSTTEMKIPDDIGDIGERVVLAHAVARLADHWHVVQAIAAELIAHKTVSAARVREYLGLAAPLSPVH